MVKSGDDSRSKWAWRARLAGATTAAWMTAWVAFSYRMMNKPVLTGEEAEAHRRSLLASMGLPELMNTWREEVLPLGDRELHL